MARAGVTYHDVATAAVAIQNNGQDPTVERVRQHLGTGSNSTLAPLLKRWRSTQLDDAAPDLPVELVRAVKSIYEQTQHLADQRIQAVEESGRQNMAALREQLAKKEAAYQQLSASTNEISQQRDALAQDKAMLTEKLEACDRHLVARDAQYDALLPQMEALTSREAELRQENKDIRAHFEHYQTHTAEDRHREREQAQRQQDLLTQQVQSLEGALSSLKNERQAQYVELTEKTNALASANQRIQALENDLSRADERNTLLEQQRLDAHQRADTLKGLNDTLTTTLEKTQQDCLVAERETALLTQSLEDKTARLAETADALALLQDQYTTLLQEKSVQEGQLRQLHAALK